MSMRDRIVELIGESGVGYVEKTRTILTTCPTCGRDDKFSIIKENGSCICYRGSCSFGKKWFADWLSLTSGISHKDARDLISGNKRNEIEKPDLRSGLAFDLKIVDPFEKDESTEALLADIQPIPFPEFHMVPISDQDAAEGLTYLEGRGISKARAEEYGIYYSRTYRRVYLPVTMGGNVYGYQGRAIDKVDDSERMRNNKDFRRETLVMFADNLINEDFAIIAEGPFDALKFDQVGGNISSMGKVVTQKQLDIIKSYGIDKLYLALDDDASDEMNQIVDTASTQFDIFKIDLPQSCIERCELNGKKADFGECTFEEAEQAFLCASRVGSKAFMYIK
jgi:Toprim domain-containing protein